MNEDDDQQKASTEEATYHSTLEIIDYEIDKKRRDIDEMRMNTDAPFSPFISTKRLIKDLEQRIAQLEQRRGEIEEQEENGRAWWLLKSQSSQADSDGFAMWVRSQEDAKDIRWKWYGTEYYAYVEAAQLGLAIVQATPQGSRWKLGGNVPSTPS